MKSKRGDGERNPKPRRPSVLAGWPRALFWLLLCGGLVFFAIRSFRHSDVLAVYTRAGNIQGVASHRGRVMLALSNLSFGPEKALTADVASASTEEGEWLYQQVFKRWEHRRELAGFGGAMSARGDVVGGATHVALVVPHWFVAALALLPVLRWALGASRRWRRTRRTGKRLCWNCGYPLVHATDRCPECGEAVETEVRASRAGLV
jgi:hypothetical protein